VREPFERILVRAPNPLGDAIMATPLLRCLRRGWPRARITVLATPAGAEAYRGLDSLDRIEVYRRGGADRGALGLWRTARRLRPERFDLAVVCPNSHSAAILARLTGARRRVGWSYNGRGFLLTDVLVPEKKAVARRIPVPMVGYYLDLARRMGAEPTDERPELATTPDGESEALRVLGEGGWREGEGLAGLGVGSSFGPSKLWTPEAFAAVGDALAAKGMKSILLFGPGEEPLARAVGERMKSKPVVGADRSLGLAAIKSLVKRLKVMVTTDTGPRHVAVAFGIPVVVIMGPTDPIYTDAHLEKTVVLREQVDCAPYRWPCHEKDCPLGDSRRHQCMERIPPERAVAAVEGLLGR